MININDIQLDKDSFAKKMQKAMSTLLSEIVEANGSYAMDEVKQVVKKKMILKIGTAGSGSWSGPGQPRFAYNKIDTKDLPDDIQSFVDNTNAKLSNKVFSDSQAKKVVYHDKDYFEKLPTGNIHVGGKFELGVINLYKGCDEKTYQHELGHSLELKNIKSFQSYCDKNKIKVPDVYGGGKSSALSEHFARTFVEYVSGFKGTSARYFISKYGDIKKDSKKSILIKANPSGVDPLIRDEMTRLGRFQLRFDVLNPNVEQFIKDRSYKFSFDISDEMMDELRDELNAGFAEGESVDKLKARIKDIFGFGEGVKENYRARRIARSEAIRASNYGMNQAYIQSEVVDGKEWYTARDERRCQYCASMHGKIIPIEGNFFNQGDEMSIKDSEGNISSMTLNYENIGAPPLHPNCRCTLIPHIKQDLLR